MKTKSFYIAFFVAISCVCGCKKFLTETPKGIVAPANFYQSDDECRTAVNGIYAYLYNIFTSPTFLVMTEGGGDLIWQNNNQAPDAIFSYSPAAPGYGEIIWTNAYAGIMNANTSIYYIEKAPISDTSKANFLGQAKFLRALYYYFLTCTFNDVPYYTDPLLTEEAVNRISQMPRTNVDTIRKAMIKELSAIAGDLPLTATGTNTGRATKGAALALLMKYALWEKDWQTTISAGESIVTDKKYQLLTSYQNVFATDNTAESIFEIQYKYDVNGIQRTHNIPSYCMPTPRTGTTAVYDGVNLGNNAITTYGNILPSTILINLYKDSLHDTRRNVVLGYSYNGVNFRRYIDYAKPWLGIKFWDLTMNNLSSGKNLVYLRYSDVLLMLSEAYNENGNSSKSLTYLNQVRKRAATADYADTNIDSLRQEVRDERGRELAGEYQRRWDLIRWGIFYSAVSAKFQVDRPSGVDVSFLQTTDDYYPLPYQEVVKNPALTQNPGYN